MPFVVPTLPGTVSEPLNVVSLRSRLLAGHPAGAVTPPDGMYIDVTVIGAASGFDTVYQKYRSTPGSKRAGVCVAEALLIVLEIEKSELAVVSSTLPRRVAR